MKKILLFLLFLICCSLPADMINSLVFSTDNGKSYQEDYPILKKGVTSFRVKVSFNCDIPQESLNSPIMSWLYCSDRDFASANRGKRLYQNGKIEKWMHCQQLKQYWANSLRSEFVYNVDIGERPAGTTGNENKWDGSKWVNDELPACNALPAGTYHFIVELSYWLKEPRKEIRVFLPFDLIVEE